MKFKIGDPVKLKGSSQVMTIQLINKNNNSSYDCVCNWIDKEGKPQQVTYDELSLILVTPPKPRQFKQIHIG